VSSALEKHVTSLHQTLINELVARLRRFTWLSSAGQKDATLLIFYGHKIGGDLDVDYVGAVAVRREIIHEKVVGIVHKEMQSVNHLPIVPNQGHLDCLIHYFDDVLLCLLFLLD
jgi:hypothetical protein